MASVRVAVPVFRGKRRFHILKGRPWSPVEHLLLQAVAKTPSTVLELSARANLPRRMIIEMLIRLMRVGLVELSPQTDPPLFRASTLGAIRADNDELPSLRKPITRWMAFFVDRVTGTLYRGREFQARPRWKLEEQNSGDGLVWLEPEDEKREIEPRDFLTCLTEEDEQIVNVDPSDERLSDLYAVVTVREGRVEGLPARAPTFLKALIIEKATAAIASRATSGTTNGGYVVQIPKADRELSLVNAAFSQDDLILGGDAHRELLNRILKQASKRIIIHSTFISEENLRAVMPALKQAVQRDVCVDILWGQGENSDGYKSTLDVIRKVSAELESAGLDASIRIHLSSTNSHAKLIVADYLAEGVFSAVVGSCNWLSTGFNSFDASVRTRDPSLVSDVLNTLAKLSRGRDGLWVPLTNDLTQLSLRAKTQPKPKGMTVPATLVLGEDHGYFVKKARDEAQQRIFVASHRLSEIGNRAVVLPAIAAAQDRSGITSRIYFNRTSGGITQSQASDLVITAGTKNVQIRPVHDPRLHAKILAWDDDSLVVTSHNWLSVESSPSQQLQEIGIFLGGGLVADAVIRTFDNAHME